MDGYIVKIQRDASGNSVLIYSIGSTDVVVQIEGETARHVIGSYHLAPFGKTYARAKVNDSGMLLLGDEVDEPA
jgi:hypothetical protein